MIRKILLIGKLLIGLSIYAQNPIEQFYEAYNAKNWKKFEKLIHKDFECIVDSGIIPASRQGFIDNMYNGGNMWFAEWKIIEMKELTPGCFEVKGTFTNEYDMWLYGAPVEGLWLYCVEDNKIRSLDWLEFPENPNEEAGMKKEQEFKDWIHLNYPSYDGITYHWGYQWALTFKDLFYAYKKLH